MDYMLILGIIFVQLGSYSTIYGLVKFKIIVTSMMNMMIIGYGVTFLVTLLTYLLFRRGYRYVDPLMYVFSFFSYISLYSVGVVLELHGIIPKALSPSAVEYVPILKSAHGLVSMYWEAVQWALTVACLALYTCRRTHREVGLYWAGSVLNGLVVVLPAIFTGKDEVSPAFIMDAFFTVVPLLALINMIHNRPIQARTFLKFPPIWRRPVDLLFFIYFGAAIHISCLRSLAVNGGNIPVVKDYIKMFEPYLADATGAPKFQMLTYDYMYGLYYLFAMYGLWAPGQHWMGDFALITAGGAAQAQFTYIAGALNSKTPAALRPAMAGRAAVVFWGVNVLLLLVPQLFVLRTQQDVEMYGRTQTVDFACPLRKKVYVIKETKEITTTTKKME